jgi:hypothetical protein
MRKEAATPTTEAATQNRQQQHSKNPAPLAKYKRVLRYMLEHGSINRLQAERAPVFDHCLPSTISGELIKRHGLVIESTTVKRAGFGGVVKQY